MNWSIKALTTGFISVIIGIVSGSYIKHPERRFSQTIGQTSARFTTNPQWRFLYLLAGKVFDYLKSQNTEIEDNIGAKGKSNLLDWLKSKFSKYTYQSDWKGFKDLCTKALAKENNLLNSVVDYNPEVRLCFMGKELIFLRNFTSSLKVQLITAAEKGNLKYLNTDSKWKQKSIKPYQNIEAFKTKWIKNNLNLWNDFKSWKSIDEDGEMPSDFQTKFEEWFNNFDMKDINSGNNNISKTSENADNKISEILKIEKK